MWVAEGGADRIQPVYCNSTLLRTHPLSPMQCRQHHYGPHSTPLHITFIIVIIKRRSGINPIPPTVKDQDYKETEAK